MVNKIDNYEDSTADLHANQPEYPEVPSDVQAQVEVKVAEAQGDPRQQKYMRNATTGRLIKTKEQYEYVVEQRQGVEVITYDQAIDLVRQERAVRHKVLNAKKIRKRVKAARKVNRG